MRAPESNAMQKDNRTTSVGKSEGEGVVGSGGSNTQSFWEASDKKINVLLAQQDKEVINMTREMRKNFKLTKDEKAKIAVRTAEELELVVKGYMDLAIKQQAGMKTGRDHSVRAERGMTKFLHNFAGYAQAYSGVVQIVKGAGLGYGEAAYGALSLFLVISVNKQKTEDFIEKTLDELRQEFLRTQMLKDVYPTERMKEYTAKLYRLGIEFLHETVRYYALGAFRRLRYIITRPPSISVELRVSDIKFAIQGLEREMRALDGVRLNAIEQAQHRMEQNQKEDRITLEEASTILNALQIRTDNDRLDLLRRLFQVELEDIESPIDYYEAQLSATFGNIRRLPEFDVDANLLSSPVFREWQQADRSGLFILHGATVAPEQTPYSWISPGAVRIVKNFDQLFSSIKGPTALAFQFCQVSETLESLPKKVSPFAVLARIIHQILRSEYGKKLLRDEPKYSDLKRNLEALVDSSANMTVKLQKLSGFIARLLQEFNIRNAVFVLDRIDRIQGGIEKMLEPMASLIESKGIMVKIFLTARARYIEDDDEWRDRLGSNRFVTLAMDQDG